MAFILARGVEIAKASNIQRLEYRPDPYSEPKAEPPPPPEAKPEPPSERGRGDCYDPETKQFMSIQEFIRKQQKPEREAQPKHSTDEIVFLYDPDGRPHRIDTRNKEELGLRRFSRR